MIKNKTIIIVEDELLVALEMQESLQHQGYHVPEIVTSAEGVLASVVKHKPHLVIMDINLGSFVDGIDTAQRMKILGNTAIVYLTAYGDEKTRERAMNTHPKDYLVKPVSDDLLHRAVARALE
ncbi:MAG: response regulator [Spirochaetaceae bacterium]|jgi:DNA-binding NarL/FixJ family response regulator|nr:response regulator [Spirochaetaceae bacterium]